MIKIAILLNTSWYIYNFRRNLIVELLKNNFEVHAIAPYDVYTEKLKDIGCKYSSIEMNSKSKNPLYDLYLLFQIRKTLKRIKPDVLLNFTIKPNIYGSVAARTLGIKCINNVAGMGTLFTDGFFSRLILKSLFKVSQLKVDTVFFQNPDDYSELTLNNIVKKKSARLLPGSGVNLNDFPYTPLKKKLDDPIEFLLPARMIYSKGIIVFIEAAKLLYEKGYNNFHISLLGETGINNPHAIPLDKLIQLCKPSYATYFGKTDDVKSFIIKSDVVVLPSYYREGTPKSLLEALSIGRPILTTNTPGCRETVINGENGFLCEPQSVKDLAEKMERFLLFEKHIIKKMGDRSRKLAEEKFDEKFVIDSYLLAIRSVIVN